MNKNGLARMLEFLDLLEEKNIHYFVTRYSPEGLTVTLTLVTVRVEVEFTVMVWSSATSREQKKY